MMPHTPPDSPWAVVIAGTSLTDEGLPLTATPRHEENAWRTLAHHLEAGRRLVYTVGGLTCREAYDLACMTPDVMAPSPEDLQEVRERSEAELFTVMVRRLRKALDAFLKQKR